MAEPTVPVPVSLIRRWEDHYSHRIPPEFYDELLALLSQPNPTAEQYTPEDGPAPWGYLATDRVEDLAPGTTFTYPTRWEVSGRGGMTGRTIAEMVEESTTRYLDDLDPSTIRDVTPPREDS